MDWNKNEDGDGDENDDDDAAVDDDDDEDDADDEGQSEGEGQDEVSVCQRVCVSEYLFFFLHPMPYFWHTHYSVVLLHLSNLHLHALGSSIV